MPPAQSISHTLEGAINSLKWLRELESQWNEKVAKKQDGSTIRKKQLIVADAFTDYFASLFDNSVYATPFY